MPLADRKPSVLLTEDEPLISLDLCEALQDAGFYVIGPANTVARSLFLLRRYSPQVAIIDLLLKDGPCSPLVQELRRSSVPFLVCSGYRQEDDPIAIGRDVPWLAKPCPPGQIIDSLNLLFNQKALA